MLRNTQKNVFLSLDLYNDSRQLWLTVPATVQYIALINSSLTDVSPATAESTAFVFADIIGIRKLQYLGCPVALFA